MLAFILMYTQTCSAGDIVISTKRTRKPSRFLFRSFPHEFPGLLVVVIYMFHHSVLSILTLFSSSNNSIAQGKGIKWNHDLCYFSPDTISQLEFMHIAIPSKPSVCCGYMVCSCFGIIWWWCADGDAIHALLFSSKFWRDIKIHYMWQVISYKH